MMTGRDDFADELLSAYLDGEVSSEERTQIAQRLAGSADYRNKLETLKALQAALQDLPRYRLPAEVHQRIMRDIQRLTADEFRGPPPSLFESELLSAYFDGEVSNEERQIAERALASSPRCRRRLDHLRELDADLRVLPTFRLGDDFAAHVRERIEAEAAFARRADSEPAELLQPAASRGASPRRIGRRSLAWSAIAVAAAVVLMVNFWNSSKEEVPRIASTPPSAEGGQPWKLIDRRLRDRMVMVCEVIVTPEGVKEGAFFRVWKRHGIRIVDTFPVPEREQRSLLACPFMHSVRRVKSAAPADIDRVQLYLVYCGARQAEAMCEDLYRGPEGIGSFTLSLTTRKVGDGVLAQLSDASGVRQKLGQAVQLVGNFGIPSSNQAQLGTFGAVSYIDPELLSPPEPPGAKDARQAEAAAGADPAGDPNAVWVPDDFPAEVLFLVRDLRASERDEQPRAVSLAK